MIWRWANSDGCRTRTALPGFARWQEYGGCLVIRRHGSWRAYVGKKNGVWRVWAMAAQFLRPATAPGARSVVRRHAHLPGRGGTPGGVPEQLRQREARAAGLAGGQSFYTKRFAFFVGPSLPGDDDQGCGQGDAPGLGHGQDAGDAVHARAIAPRGDPGAKAIGIDEISIRKGHTYRIVVSDLDRMRPIWFGGKDRSEASMDEFFAWLGPKKSQRIRLAVMDMWKAFRNSTRPPRARRPAFCSTSSMSCAIWAMRSIRCASASTSG